MVKKYVSGENLVYALNLFEKKIKEMINNITHIEQATNNEVIDLFKEVEVENKE